MNYEDEINERNEIMGRISSGKKMTPEERLWLATHRIYNRQFGYPYLNKDIVYLQPGITYRIKVKAESISYPGRILPVFTVPSAKGKIIFNEPVRDFRGNVKIKKPIKTLALLLNKYSEGTEFTYCSDLGLLDVSFECEYYDSLQRLIIRKNSSLGDPNYAMIRECVEENKVIYRCKAPVDESFDSLVFSVEWMITG